MVNFGKILLSFLSENITKCKQTSTASLEKGTFSIKRRGIKYNKIKRLDTFQCTLLNCNVKVGKKTHSMKEKIKKRRVIDRIYLISTPIISRPFSYTSFGFLSSRRWQRSCFRRRQRRIITWRMWCKRLQQNHGRNWSFHWPHYPNQHHLSPLSPFLRQLN